VIQQSESLKYEPSSELLTLQTASFKPNSYVSKYERSVKLAPLLCANEFLHPTTLRVYTTPTPTKVISGFVSTSRHPLQSKKTSPAMRLLTSPQFVPGRFRFLTPMWYKSGFFLQVKDTKAAEQTTEGFRMTHKHKWIVDSRSKSARKSLRSPLCHARLLEGVARFWSVTRDAFGV